MRALDDDGKLISVFGNKKHSSDAEMLYLF